MFLSHKFANLWAFEAIFALFDDKFVKKQHFVALFFFLPKSLWINKCWFLWQILQQIFRWDPKVPCLRILWLYDYFWVKKNILNLKKKHLKKKNFLNQKHKKKHKKAHKKSSPEICEKMRKKYAYWISIFFGLKKNLTFFFFFNSKYPNLLKKSRTTMKFIGEVL